MRNHGWSKTRIYNIWKMMRGRCTIPTRDNYQYYGALDIKVCPEWDSFLTFLADMKDTYFEGATLDRIDNTKGYSKENCRWLTHQENAQNSSTVILTIELAEEIRRRYAEEKITQTELGRQYGVKQGTISAIITRRQWTNGASLR